MFGWLATPATARARPARVGPMVRQRISEYSLGSSDWAGSRADNPRARKVKRRIDACSDNLQSSRTSSERRAASKPPFSYVEFTSLYDSASGGKSSKFSCRKFHDGNRPRFALDQLNR